MSFLLLIYPSHSNKGFSLRFYVDSWVWHEILEESRRIYWPKHSEYNNKDELNSMNILRNYYNLINQCFGVGYSLVGSSFLFTEGRNSMLFFLWKIISSFSFCLSYLSNMEFTWKPQQSKGIHLFTWSAEEIVTISTFPWHHLPRHFQSSHGHIPSVHHMWMSL